MFKQSIAANLLDLCPGSVLVGGTVRNMCLGISQVSTDYDLLVAGNRLSPTGYVEKYLPESVILKTVGSTVRLKQHFAGVDIPVFDLTVVPDSLEHDLKRRDLTVNGLCLSTSTNGHQSIQDFVGGVGDCYLRRIETFEYPGQVWASDPCRIVRAIRFKSQLSEQTGDQWQFGPKVTAALYEGTDSACAMLSYCNSSRLRNEVLKLLKSRPAAAMFRDLSALPPSLTETLFSLAGGRLTLAG
jgi:tRNA nucleotidyltransferase/poly(A) polymerase